MESECGLNQLTVGLNQLTVGFGKLTVKRSLTLRLHSVQKFGVGMEFRN